jgi:putative DNA primase/helicase
MLITKMVSTKERARGRWREILPALGIAESFLTGRNCACPLCGGTDRFRFIDRRGQDGDGMWVCNQCQPRPRPAMDLVMAFTGKPFREAARAVDDILGDRPAIQQPRTPIRPTNEPTSYSHLKVWRRGVPVRPGDLADRYLRHRGVGMNLCPPCLRFCELDWVEDQYGVRVRHPAMFAAVTNPAGEHVATHRTFLAADGRGNADMKPRRKTTGKFGSGPTIRLMPMASMMGIGEGIETALAAAKLFHIPMWSVLCAHGIETFVPPHVVQHLIVFADHDLHGASLRAAETLKAMLSVTVEIRMPDKPGDDWNDVLLSEMAR